MSCNLVVQSNPGNLNGLQLELFKKNESYGLQPGCKKQPGLLNWVATHLGLQPEFSNPKTTQPLKNPNQ